MSGMTAQSFSCKIFYTKTNDQKSEGETRDSSTISTVPENYSFKVMEDLSEKNLHK